MISGHFVDFIGTWKRTYMLPMMICSLPPGVGPAPNGVTYIRHCFVARPVKHHPERALDTGIIAAHWFSSDEIFAPDFPARSPIVRRVLRDYLSGIRYPLALIHHHEP